jgi:guanine nucleotide-binding protein subunit beta-2-like 1 protein
MLSFIHEMETPNGGITALHCSLEDTTVRLVSASADGTVSIWVGADVNTFRSQTLCRRDISTGGDSTINPGDVFLAGNQQRGEFVFLPTGRALEVHSLRACRVKATFDSHESDVLSCAVSPTYRTLASGDTNGIVKVWNARGAVRCTFDAHQGGVTCMRLSPSTKTILCTGGHDHAVKVWRVKKKRGRGYRARCLHTMTGHTDCVTSLAISPDGSLCASSSKDGTARVWDLLGGQHLWDFSGSGGSGDPVNQIAFSPVRYWMVLATESGVRVFDLETRAAFFDYFSATVACTAIAWSWDGASLYAGFADSTIRVWRDSSEL